MMRFTVAFAVLLLSLSAHAGDLHFTCTLKSDPSTGIYVVTERTEFNNPRVVNIPATVNIFKSGVRINRLNGGVIGHHNPIKFDEQHRALWSLGVTMALSTSLSMGYQENKQTWFLYIMTPDYIVREPANCSYMNEEALFLEEPWG